MARRPRERREFNLSPGARRVAGWVAAVAIVGGIALGVRIVGGSGEGSPEEAGSASAQAVGALPIIFGTSLDATTGVVAAATRAREFRDGDSFVYSVADLEPPPTVYVEVERLGGGPAEVVQEASAQTIAPDSPAVAFSVPAAALLEAFGPGEYRMRLYRPGESAPVAQGTFVLVASIAPSPGSSA
jgi:hypothetical protein